MRSPTRAPRTRLRCCGVALALAGALAACSTHTTSYEIVQRSPTFDPDMLEKDYGVEREYIARRREQLAADDSIVMEYNDECFYRYGCYWNATERKWTAFDDEESPPGEVRSSAACDWCQAETLSIWQRRDGDDGVLTGLAFSGGGIRSASFNLGALQALDALHALPRIDYMSSVSGGSYAAGWVQGHLGADQHGYDRDYLHYKVGADDFHDLTDDRADNVEQLRTHAQFLNEGGYFEGLELFWEYLWRWPLSMIVDVGLHLKRNYNEIHPITVYEDRIKNTYFRGQPCRPHTLGKREPACCKPAKYDAKLNEMNRGPFPAPYLIINGNLVNWGTARSGKGGRERNFNFEFTRDFVGSDGLGYIPSVAFDRPVSDVHGDEHNRPLSVEVEGDETEDSSFRITQAVAASGAAFDPDGGLVTVDNAFLRVPAYYISPLVNLNLGYETWNFSRGYNGVWTPVDYARMQTYQRFIEPETDARWIKVTDGGHYENLAIATLARRGVACIIATDVGADPHLRCKDLHNLAKVLARHGLKLGLDEHEMSSICHAGRGRFQITRGPNPGGEVVSTVLYLKPNADAPQLEPGDESPHHLAKSYWTDGVEYDKAPATADSIDKILAYKRSKEQTKYPHTSTFVLSYDWETFEAYRQLGFQMAKTYLPHGADLTKCEFNPLGEP